MSAIHPTRNHRPARPVGPRRICRRIHDHQRPVTIGPASQIGEHCVLQGATVIGRNCKIGPAAYVGMDPQHLKFVADEANPTYLMIGDDVHIRESARFIDRPSPARARDPDRRPLLHHGSRPRRPRLRAGR